MNSRTPETLKPPSSRWTRASLESRYENRRNPLPIWKRTLDVICILFALPALLPLMGLIALAIRICSRGPILFRQERIGLFGQPFVCLKFRTMKAEAETDCHEAHLETLIRSEGPMTKLDAHGDARVIRVGGFLRATGLDELPQLINVLNGEMSLIGPRPCIRYEYEKFSAQDRARFNVLPGLTGLWQVSGKNSTTFQRMIDLDIEYAQGLSLAGDLKILWRTWPVVFQQARVHRRKAVVSPVPASFESERSARRSSNLAPCAIISTAHEPEAKVFSE